MANPRKGKPSQLSNSVTPGMATKPPTQLNRQVNKTAFRTAASTTKTMHKNTAIHKSSKPTSY